MSHSIVLASASAARSRILSAAGIPHTIAPAGIDEHAVRKGMPDATGEIIALELATRKAVTVSAQHAGSWVISCDQVLDCGGALYGKPANIAAARAQLEFLRGKTHGLSTAVAVARDESSAWSHVETPRLTMRRFTDTFLDSYLEAVG